MPVPPARAGDRVHRAAHRLVGDDAQLPTREVVRAHEADGRAGRALDLLLGGEREALDAERVLQRDLVRVEVAADERDDVALARCRRRGT